MLIKDTQAINLKYENNISEEVVKILSNSTYLKMCFLSIFCVLGTGSMDKGYSADLRK